MSDVRRAFRKISLKYHPDRSTNPDHVPIFIEANHAYEVLSDSSMKADYDDMLRNPQNYYTNRMRFYKHKFKQMRPSTVVYSTILLITVLHYLYWRSRHYKVIDQIRRNPQVREKLEAIAAEREEQRRADLEAKGLNPYNCPFPSDAELLANERSDVVSIAEIQGWQGRLPTFADLFVVRLFWLPGGVLEYIAWMVKFYVLRSPPTTEYEMQYFTASAVGMDWAQWQQVGKSTRQPLLRRQLWIPENYDKFVRDNKMKRRRR